MLLFVPKETYAGETRIALVPDSVKKLVKLGAEITIEAGMGLSCGYADEAYTALGATVSTDRNGMLGKADMVLRLRKPPFEEIAKLKKGAIHVSHLDPFNDFTTLDEFAKCGVSSICMEMLPRTSLAQKMDALSSQANIAGYAAVILAASKLPMVLPMMMTPSGTIKPSRVFIIGVGVAGLQAIATAKRLGAAVEAFDTRPVVEEQVLSLGAKFVKVDLGETGQTKDGYAVELTDEQKAKQREGMAKAVASADVVITTAQLFGKKAPIIVTKDMIAAMRKGSVVVDIAADTGGNVEGTVPGQEVDVDGVKLIGMTNPAAYHPVHASQMYSANLVNLLEQFWNKQDKVFTLKLEDEIIKGCLVVHDGELRNEMLKQAKAKAQ